MRVPVLSTQTTSTRASTSTAASSCTSAPRRPSRITPTAKATLVSSTSPSGIMAPTPATEPRTPVVNESALRTWEMTRRIPAGHEGPGADPQDGVRALAQLGAHVREPLGLLGQARRRRRHRRRRSPRTGRDRRPRSCRSARPRPRILLHGLALAAEQRLVHLELDGGEHHAVHRDLIAGRDVDDVAGHDLFGGDLVNRAVADDPHARGADHGEPVEGDLGSQLLDDADQRVGHQDDPEQRVAVLLGGQHHQQERAEDGVEAGEDVGAQDVADGATVVVGRDVDEAAGTLRGHLVRREPPLGVGQGGRGLQGGDHPSRMAPARRFRRRNPPQGWSSRLRNMHRP